MKLYWHPNSQPSRTSMAVAKHLGLDLEAEKVDLLEGAQRKPEYLAINPNGKVPALVDGDLRLWESAAIQEYLTDVAGDAALRPRDPKAWADVNRWRAWALTTWNRPLGGLTFQRLFRSMLGLGDPDPEVIATSDTEFRAAAALLNTHLVGKDWVSGGALSLADFALASMLTYWRQAKVPLEDFPEVRRWYAGIEELPCWKETEPPKGR